MPEGEQEEVQEENVAIELMDFKDAENSAKYLLSVELKKLTEGEIKSFRRHTSLSGPVDNFKLKISYSANYFGLTEKLTERINCIPLYEWIISRHRTIIRTMNKWLDDFSIKKFQNLKK